MPGFFSRLCGTVLMLFAAAALTSCRSASSTNRPAPADLVLRGGRIVTLDDRVPEAEALAARDGRVVALGTAADIAPFIGPATEVVELKTAFAMPGFIEGHGHFTGSGENRLNLDLPQ
jgi:predicted amidohydrolase YtcJ